MTNLISILLNASLAFSLVAGSDWSEWRGPSRDGVSLEKNLPVKWSPAGDNLAWRAPYGGRSAPIVMGDRVYMINTAGKGETLQERVICLNADTGKLLPERRASTSRRLGLPRRRSIDGKRLRVWRWRQSDGARS